MLTELSVQNFAIVENNSFRMDSGMTCFTGETGAGKSLLLNAISLLLGSKSSKELVRRGEETALVQGSFDLSGDSSKSTWLSENGFLVEDSQLLLVKREISANSGRSRIWIQGQAATRPQLQSLLGDWIEVSGQHEFLSLNREDYLLEVLDQYGGLASQREEYEKLFLRYKELSLEREELISKNTDKESLLELRRFQLKELEKAKITDNLEEEEEQLKQLGQKMRASEKIKKACAEAAAHLGYNSSFDNSPSVDILELLSKIESSLAEFSKMDARIEQALNNLKEARSSLWDCGAYLNETQEEFDVDPRELESSEARLSLIKKLQRKYLCDSDGLLTLKDNFKKEISELENFEAELSRIEAAMTLSKKTAWTLATKLHENRLKTAKELSGLWEKGIRELGMAKARLLLQGTKNEKLSRSGVTKVQALFSANPGTEPSNLSKVASGGELSRILLALKHLVSKGREVCAYLFDEIDTGIGGEIAQTVGSRLKEISKHSQVIVVTHLAQVAAMADVQFSIEKTSSKKDTKTAIRLLSAKERKSEIARMLGSTQSKAAQSLAREMLLQANS